MTPEKIRAKSHVGAFGIHIYGLRLKSGCAKPYTPTWKGFCGKESNTHAANQIVTCSTASIAWPLPGLRK